LAENEGEDRACSGGDRDKVSDGGTGLGLGMRSRARGSGLDGIDVGTKKVATGSSGCSDRGKRNARRWRRGGVGFVIGSSVTFAVVAWFKCDV
jgi:hypothetical protein